MNEIVRLSKPGAVKRLRDILEHNPPQSDEIRGNCPLSEPQWTTVHPRTLADALSTISVRKQPKFFQYDSDNKREKKRYLEDLNKSLRNKEITRKQYDQLRKLA